jgi:hypothetical protein
VLPKLLESGAGAVVTLSWYAHKSGCLCSRPVAFLVDAIPESRGPKAEPRTQFLDLAQALN